MSNQRQFDFTPGLTEQFSSLEDVVLAVVRNVGVKQGSIAQKCDLSPGEFSKSLNHIEGRRIDLSWLEYIVSETKDVRPIHYLMEKFLESPEARLERALDIVHQLGPVFLDAMQTIKTEAKRR